MQMLAARTIIASASVALAAGVAGAFIALAVDDGDATIIQGQPPPVADATGALASPPAAHAHDLRPDRHRLPHAHL